MFEAATMLLQDKEPFWMLEIFAPMMSHHFSGMIPDQRHHHIEDIRRATEFADHLIKTCRRLMMRLEAAHDVLEAVDLTNSSANENPEEESPTSDIGVDAKEHCGMIEMHAQRRRTM